MVEALILLAIFAAMCCASAVLTHICDKQRRERERRERDEEK